MNDGLLFGLLLAHQRTAQRRHQELLAAVRSTPTIIYRNRPTSSASSPCLEYFFETKLQRPEAFGHYAHAWYPTVGERGHRLSYCDGVKPDYSEASVQLMLIVVVVLHGGWVHRERGALTGAVTPAYA
jgi:hypothetical protein